MDSNIPKRSRIYVEPSEVVSDGILITSTLPLNEIDDVEFRTELEDSYNDSMINNVIACYLNSCFAEKLLVNSFGRKEINDVLKQDTNSKANSISPRDYKKIAQTMIKKNLIKIIKFKTKKNETNLYEVIYEPLRKLVIARTSQEYIDQQKIDALEFWNSSDSTSEVFTEAPMAVPVEVMEPIPEPTPAPAAAIAPEAIPESVPEPTRRPTPAVSKPTQVLAEELTPTPATPTFISSRPTDSGNDSIYKVRGARFEELNPGWDFGTEAETRFTNYSQTGDPKYLTAPPAIEQDVYEARRLLLNNPEVSKPAAADVTKTDEAKLFSKMFSLVSAKKANDLAPEFVGVLNNLINQHPEIYQSILIEKAI